MDYRESITISAHPTELFNYLDDHKRLSRHMTKSSMMMAGSSMEIRVDEGKGQRVGSHIMMDGKIFGLKLNLDEVVTYYDPPFHKKWQTVGTPHLLVIGNYEMGFDIVPQNDNSSLLTIFINYDYPDSNRWLGYLFGSLYAKWCVRMMLKDVKNYR